MDIEVVVVYVGALCWNSSPWGPEEYNLEAQCKIFKVQATGTPTYHCASKDEAKSNLYILNLETTVKQHTTILEHVSFAHTFLGTQSEGISLEM